MNVSSSELLEAKRIKRCRELLVNPKNKPSVLDSFRYAPNFELTGLLY